MANIYTDIKLFDAEYYLANNPDVAAAIEGTTDITAQDHYFLHGAAENLNGGAENGSRAPNSWFNAAEYVAQNPDLADVDANLLLAHFALHGMAEGRAPNAATAGEDGKIKSELLADYVNAEGNEDVKAAIAEMTGTAVGAELTAEQAAIAIQHFFNYGINEDRKGGIADVIAGEDEGEGSEGEGEALTEALETLAQAESLVGEKAEAIGEFLEVKNYDPAGNAANVTAAETEVLTAQSTLDAAVAKLSAARATDLSTDTTPTLGADYTSLTSVTGIPAATTLSAANVTKIVKNALADVKANPAANALYEAMLDAQDALASDVAANGSDEAVARALNDAIVAYLQAGGADSAANDLAAVRAAFTAQEVLATPNWAVVIAAADNAFVITRDTDGNVTDVQLDDGGTLKDLDPVSATLTKNILDALKAAAVVAVDREDLITAETTAETAFSTNILGGLYELALDLQQDFVDMGAAITTATEARDEAQTDLDTLNSLVADYDNAVSSLEDAQQYFEDNDLELPVVLTGQMNATSGSDIFLFSSETATVRDFGLEGEDSIFFGEGFTLFEITGNVGITGNHGDVNTLEILWQQVGNNVELWVEAEAFAGNGSGTADLTKVTLVGVNGSDLQDNLDNGLLSLGEVVA